MDNDKTPVSLWAIFRIFFQVGLVSFGGGLSAWFYREIVERRKWLAPEDFFSGLALGQGIAEVHRLGIAVRERPELLIGRTDQQ